MPSNQTTNYQLSQWVKSDQVRMEDFNADNAKIDAVLSGLAGAAAGHSESLTAHAGAIAKLGNCAVKIVTYGGSDSMTVTLSCPHPPVAAYVRYHGGGASYLFVKGLPVSYLAGGSGTAAVPTWGANSISWKPRDTSSSDAESMLNRSGLQYTAIILMNASL